MCAAPKGNKNAEKGTFNEKEKKPDKRITMTIKRCGYEYTLVEAKDRSSSIIRQPCFWGHENCALKSCRKIMN